MKNADYWRGRFAILEKAANAKGADYYRALGVEFKRASRAIQADTERWYGRFADNNGITMAQAKKWLTTAQLEEFRWTVQDYIKAGESLDPKWFKQLENASTKVHISRLESLQLQIQQQIEVLYGNQVDDLDALMRRIYSDGYYHTAFEIQKGLNVGWDLHSINSRQLDAALSKPWTTDMRTFRDRCWTNKAELVGTVQTQMVQAILRGDAPDKAIKAIAERFNVSKSKAGRLVMTESAYASAQAQKDCFNELDVERYQILVTLDLKTSEVCQSLDKKVLSMSEYEPGVTAPPFHPWCRTTTIPFFDDMVGERAARDADGNVYYVPGDMTYEEWLEQYVKSDPKEYAAYKGTRNEAADRAQFEKYKAIYGGGFPDSLEGFWDLKYNNTEKWDRIKADKQDRLNGLDYSPIFDGKLGNYEVRSWYVTHDKGIPLVIDSAASLKERAQQAFDLRNTYKMQARKMMADTAAAKLLNEREPMVSFADFVQYKMKKYGLSIDEAYKDILRSAGITRTSVNEKLGIE